jgi:arylsulfatase A-like enzyme
MNPNERPNVLLVVLDCGRWSDLPGGPSPIPNMPFAEALFRQSLSFPRAVSPSPWTVPAHASLFTGLYPWEHGAHLKKDLKLEPGFPTLASRLGAAGYASFSASANGFVSPDLGLTNGFESAAWGTWWERLLHQSDHTAPPHAFGRVTTRKLPKGSSSERVEELVRTANRFPVLEAAANRLAGHLRRRNEHFSPEVASWVEPTVSTWLQRQPVSRPAFVFVNYLEPHEPYIADPGSGPDCPGWLELSHLRMDWTGFLSGRWVPSPEQLRDLRRMYRTAVQGLDARLKRLVSIFEQAGRWENTVMVLTSDHGQAFGERRYLFHSTVLWEPVVRIPMWIRYPDGHLAGKQGTGWASLIDVAPTLLRLASDEQTPFGRGLSLDDLVDRPRPDSVFTVGDGCPAAERGLKRWATPEVVRFWNQPQIAAYQGDWKFLQFPDSGVLEAHELTKDPDEATDRSMELGTQAEGILRQLRDPIKELTASPHVPRAVELQNRLASWGYD